LNDVQKLAGRIAALSQFVARLGEKALPFYALMKKSDDKFEWTEEADIPFAQLKKVLSTPQGRLRPRFSTGASMFKRDSLASAMETSVRDEKP
jgi:hypothetical protein